MTPHTSDACPVPPEAVVLIDLHDGQTHIETARTVYWGPGLADDGAGRVHGYRVLLPADVATMAPHTGDACPVPPDTLVQVDLGDDVPRIDRADAWAWGPGEGRIMGYAVLLPAVTPPL